MEQCNGNRKRIYIKWPDTGASAKDILKINMGLLQVYEILMETMNIIENHFE